LVETDAANNAAYRVALEPVGRFGVSGLYGRISAEVVRSAMGLSGDEVNEVVRNKVEAYCHELWRTRLGVAADDFRCVLINRSAH